MNESSDRQLMTWRMGLRASCLGLAALVLAAAPSGAADARSKMSEDAWLQLYGKAKGRKKTPRRNVSSAETVSKIPGPPVVPQMKSERKRTPPPDRLIGKVVWGLDASVEGDDE